MGIWTYLVAYRGRVNGVEGNAVVTRPRPIDSAQEVADVEAWLRRNGVASAFLVNVVLLKRRRFTKWKDMGTAIIRAEDEPGVTTGISQSQARPNLA